VTSLHQVSVFPPDKDITFQESRDQAWIDFCRRLRESGGGEAAPTRIEEMIAAAVASDLGQGFAP
jgi:hypothetical protein